MRENNVLALLGKEAEALLQHVCKTIPKENLVLPGPDFVDRVVALSDRSPNVLRAFEQLFRHGRLAGTGYLSILPVDQGVEHSAGASFAKNTDYFDPLNIVELAMEGGCNAVASTVGVLGMVARRYAHKIPFIVKLNHNELLSYPNSYDQIFFGQVEQAWRMGAVAIGSTIYFGSIESRRQIQETAAAFAKAHDLGMVTILWCYLRNDAFTQDQDYSLSADLTGQANHLGVTIQADIIKQKMAVNNGGFQSLPHFGKTSPLIYDKLTSSHPIDLARYQVANCYMGRAGLISSGGESGANDVQEAVKTAIINKRAGGMGMIVGRKAFQRPIKEGIQLLHAIQDVYLDRSIGIA